MYTNFPLVNIDYRYGGVSNAYVIDLSQGAGGGGVTRKRPLGQVGKCENPLDIYSQTSTNVHLSRLTATLCRGTVQTMTLVLTSLQRQRPQKRVRNNQNHISTTASFSTTDEKRKNGHEI